MKKILCAVALLIAANTAFSQDKLIRRAQSLIEENKLDDQITLAGSFCAGKCNREGVTVTVDDEIFAGLTEEKFPAFFEKKVLGKLKSEGVF